jgi:autophagy-related protein 17
MSKTDQYPETLQTTIQTIQSSLPLDLPTSTSTYSLASSPNLTSPSTSPSTFPPLNAGPSSSSQGYSPTIQTLTSILTLQDTLSNEMAAQLESLTAHYGNMAQALHDSEEAAAARTTVGGSPSKGDGSGLGGEGEMNGAVTVLFSDEDLMEINSDTEELPVILGELEESCEAIEAQQYGFLL